MNMLNTEAWLNSISRLSRIPIVLLLGLIFLGLTFTVFRQSPALAQPQTSSPARVEPITLGIGDPVSRIQCTAGYTAYLYTDQLVAPHGLAFGPDGYLYAAEESPGRVSRIDPNGAVTPILTGLTGPEGIAQRACGRQPSGRSFPYPAPPTAREDRHGPAPQPLQGRVEGTAPSGRDLVYHRRHQLGRTLGRVRL